MRFRALASDYDGTLASHGKVFPETVAALQRLLESGRKLVLVTGRELDELLAIFPECALFEWVVAENGALLYRPESGEEKPLIAPPPPAFVETLHARGVSPISVGRVIVATWEPHEQTVLSTIRDLGLELQVIFNKGAVMVLPAGVNKASGLNAVLKIMELSPHEVVGIGDAENDHALLTLCECGVAVANALPALKERADLVTTNDHGAGVVELIDQLVENDLAVMRGRLSRHHLLLGTRVEGGEARFSPYGSSLLVTGPPESGKTAAVGSVLERFQEQQYQFCIIDPDGSYAGRKGIVSLGNSTQWPTSDEALQVMSNPSDNVVVSLMEVPREDRPFLCSTLLSRIQEMRSRTGRPHWVILNAADQLFPATWKPEEFSLPLDLSRMIFVSSQLEEFASADLAKIGTLLVTGPAPEVTLEQFCSSAGIPCPAAPRGDLQPGKAWYWPRHESQSPTIIRLVTASPNHVRPL